jgi:hypothetical protein
MHPFSGRKRYPPPPSSGSLYLRHIDLQIPHAFNHLCIDPRRSEGETFARTLESTIVRRLTSTILEMADALYLSLWYPNLRLASLAEKLTAVLGEFAKHGGEPLVYAATVWPVSWQEAPVFQRVYGRVVLAAGSEGPVQLGAEPRMAVEDALELLHDDYAYEFQIGWILWELEAPSPETGRKTIADPLTALGLARDDKPLELMRPSQNDKAAGVEPRWVLTPRLVRVTGFGPLFDEGTYEREGHIRIDFGSDTPFLEEEADLDSNAARLMAENVRRLVDLTNGVEKASGATARLLWSELGESLAQRLSARLSKGN